LRLLNAAKKFKIVPVGFIAGQLHTERELAQRPERVLLPSGFVTMLMTDIEGSTALVQHLGPRYRQLIDEVWAILRQCVVAAGGHEVEARADEFFAVFEAPRAAVDAAIAMQRELEARTWTDQLEVRVRVGIHSGYPTSTDTNYIGMDVNTASRITGVGHGGQVVVSANTREGVMASAPDGVRFKSLGSHKLRGLPDAVPLYQVAAKGLRNTFPALRA
jgi:class 3 adenylate cyclase